MRFATRYRWTRLAESAESSVQKTGVRDVTGNTRLTRAAEKDARAQNTGLPIYGLPGFNFAKVRIDGSS
jgi:hypothetical protein